MIDKLKSSEHFGLDCDRGLLQVDLVCLFCVWDVEVYDCDVAQIFWMASPCCYCVFVID